MPSKTAKQARTMRAAKHDKEIRDKLNISKKTAEKFVRADQRKKGK